jgi:hypothetical protein
MSRRKWFWLRGLAALFMVVAVVVGGYAVYRISWSQGYQAGQLTTGTEGGVTTPHLYPPFGLHGGFLTVGLIILMLIVVRKTFRFLFWSSMMAHGPRSMGPSWGRRFHRGHHHGHHRMPPWFCYWEEGDEKGSEESNADSDQAEA